MNIKKTFAMALVAAAALFGFTTEAQAATQTLKLGYGSSLALNVGGRYVNPTVVSATSSSSGVLTVTKYRSLSSGRYFAKVTAKKVGKATIKVRYGSKYYSYNFSVVAPKPVPPSPSFTALSSTSFRIWCGKVANAKAYRLLCNAGSASWNNAAVTGTASNPSWTIKNPKKGVRYYFWIAVQGADGKWYGNSSRWRCVTAK